MNLPDLWQHAYLNAIRSGKWQSTEATKIADAAVREFIARFRVDHVTDDEDLVVHWFPRQEWTP